MSYRLVRFDCADPLTAHVKLAMCCCCQGSSGVDLEAASSQQTSRHKSRRKRGSLSSLMALSLAHNANAEGQATKVSNLGVGVNGRRIACAEPAGKGGAASGELTDSVHSHEDDTEALHKV